MTGVTFADRVYMSMLNHTASGYSLMVKEGWTPDAIIVECKGDPIMKPIWRIQRFVDGSLEVDGTLDAAGNAALAEINSGIFHEMSWDEYDAYRAGTTSHTHAASEETHAAPAPGRGSNPRGTSRLHRELGDRRGRPAAHFRRGHAAITGTHRRRPPGDSLRPSADHRAVPAMTSFARILEGYAA